MSETLTQSDPHTMVASFMQAVALFTNLRAERNLVRADYVQRSII